MSASHQTLAGMVPQVLGRSSAYGQRIRHPIHKHFSVELILLTGQVAYKSVDNDNGPRGAGTHSFLLAFSVAVSYPSYSSRILFHFLTLAIREPPHHPSEPCQEKLTWLPVRIVVRMDWTDSSIEFNYLRPWIWRCWLSIPKGIGRGMFDHYATQPNNTIVAAVRNVEAAQELLGVAHKGENTKVIIAKIDSSSRTDPFDAVKSIQEQGVDRK